MSKHSEFNHVMLFLILAGVLILSNSSIFRASAAPLRFTHGVASGDVTSTSAVLWTRTNEGARINLEITNRDKFDRPEFVYTSTTSEAKDFTAKITAINLKPNTQYQYRWLAGDVSSDVGMFKTAPIENPPIHVHFAWSGDTDPSINPTTGGYHFGSWKALQAASSEKPDFFIYLGDTIYSDVRGNNGIRGIYPPANNIGEFRNLYKQARDVTALHNLLKGSSIYALWDDNDVSNDWAGQTVDKSRYEIGKQSFNEYMPIQSPWTPSDSYCAGPSQFRVEHWGKNADLIILDTRSCRSAEAKFNCIALGAKFPDLAPTLPGSIRVRLNLAEHPPAGCLEAIKDPSRTILGNTQKSMFKKALLESKAKFKFVISSVNIQQTYATPYDRWEGYDAERSEIINFIKKNLIKNVIFLSTDSHQNLINDVSINPSPSTEPVIYEFVTGPVAALTEEKSLNALGAFFHQDYLKMKKDVLTSPLVKADCGNLDKFSYGTVDIKPNGSLTITLKDENGIPISDELHPGGPPCAKTLRAIS